MNPIIGIYKRTVSILCIILLCANCVSASPINNYTLSPPSAFSNPEFSELSGLIKELFDWARGWRSRAPIRAINLRKWLTSSPRRLSPTQVGEAIIIYTPNSTLIFYPKETNELGIELPNSIYRVYRIPRCIDIDTQHKLDSIFKDVGIIKMAERIAEILLNGEEIPNIVWGEPRESVDTLILHPGVFLWAQRILRQKLGNAPTRYALERKLILTLLLQSFPALDPDFGKALEEFSQHGGHMGKWLDLEYADSFILSENIYKKPQLFNPIAQMAKQIEDIYREMDGNEIEMNSCINVCSSLKALARIINEFGIGEDFPNPIKIAARLCLYFTELDKRLNLLILLRNIKEGLSRYQKTGIKGLDDLLKEIDRALEEKGTLEDSRKGILGEVLLNLFSMLPKADIHHHLDGSISPELAFKILQRYPRLAELYGNPKSPEDLKPYIEFNYRGEGEINWDELWPKFALFTHIVNTSLDEVAFVFRESSLEDFYNDGLTLIEHKVSIITLGQDPKIAPSDVLEAAVRGLIEAEKAAGGKLQTGLIPCIWKTPQRILGSRYAEVAERAKSDPGIIIREAGEEALRQVKIVVELKKRWERERPEYVQYLIGIDTVGDEKDYIREITAPALQYAAENGLNITEHLGENWNPGELKQALLRIKQGIESGIIKRIGHATALGIETKDEEIHRMQEEIKELIRKNGIHIETCPSSNKLLAPERSIPRYKDHPVVRFYRELGNVSINTDDSWILHTRGLSGEFMKVWLANPEVRWGEIEDIIGNGFKASFIDTEDRLRVAGIQRLRLIIHDILNCLSQITPILGMQSRRGLIERDEYDRHYTKMDEISKGYEEIRNSIGVMAAIDYFRNNTNVYRDFADWVLIKVESLKDKEGKEIIEVLENSTRNLLNLLSEIEGKGSKETDPIDLIKIMRSLSVTTSDVNLELDIPGDLPEVLIPQDELSILRVFWNLIGNSIRALQDMTKKDTTFIGKIKISARVDKGRLMLSFEDNGSGIREEHLETPPGSDRPWIFLSGATTKTDEPGEHGLGLSYVWETVVNIWKGKIKVESKSGIGTKFIIEIPLPQQESLEELIPSPWLEDDPIVTDFIHEALTTEGPRELKELDDNELCQRLYYALEYPGIGLPGRPAPRKQWWRHVVIHLKGTVIGGEKYIEENEKVREALAKHQSISNLLKEWLRRKWNIVRVVNALEILLTRYSNVHRGMGQHSQISTHLYEKAREIVAEYLGVDLNIYTVLFGSDLERIKENLIPGADYKVVDPEISSLFGITAVAVRKENLRKGTPYEPGGGTVALVLENDVVWADSPDRFEPGTPHIAGAIALAKALQIGLKPQQETTTIDPDRLIKEIFYQEDPGEKSLADLRQDLIGWQAGVPTRNGYLPYVNFDNGASTPTFRVVFDAYKKALRLPASVRDRLIEEVRRICRDFFNAPQGEYDVIFTKNTTEGINIIAHNLELPPGSVVLNSFLEHNSNELPWRYMPGISQERLSVDKNGFFDLNELEDKLHNNPKIKLVAISGASNVLGSVNDIKEIARISHRYGAMVLVDAAQLIAHRQIDMHEWGIDFIAFSGHKAYAPFGASGIVVRRSRLKEGIKDIDNTAGITALGRALLMLKQIGMEHLVQHEKELTEYTLERLKGIDGIVIYGTTDPEDLARRLGVISFNIKDLPHALVAGVLAEEGGIGVRSGCFCAHLLMQKMLGISQETVLSTRDELKRGIRPQMPGEVRISLGLYNTVEEIDRMIEILKKIAAGEYDLTRYQYEKETGHYYTRKYKARLDIFIHQLEEQVFGISHYKDAISLSNISDGNRRLLGNKGVKFGAFNKLETNYPNGFIIDSDTIRNTNDPEFLDNLFFPWIRSQIRALEIKTGKVFGNPQNPLLVAVRSSPESSMPAILSTILNVGINDEIAQNLAQRYGEFYAYDTYRRFIEEYGISVLGLDKGDFETIFQQTKEKGMKAVVDEYKKYIASSGKEIPQDVWVQLEESMVVVIRSWDTPRAKLFRVAEGISKEAGFSVIVQEMVFGNLNKHSAAGVLFTRNPNTGKDEIFGNYLTGSQGEDIVSGRLSGMPIQDLRDEFPDIFKRLVEIGKTLEKAQSWPQEIEFVIEDGKLYILQTRDIEFAAPVRGTVLEQLEEEGITNRYQAIDRLEKWQLRQRTRRIFKVRSDIAVNPLLSGISSTPGAVKGRLALNIDKALEYTEQGDGVILLLTPQSKGILRNLFVLPHVGLITTFGNESFHEAVLCRLSGVPAIICVDEEELRAKFKEGDLITLDGDNNHIFVAEEDVLEEVQPITDITYGIDIIEYQREFNKGKEEFSYEELVELNVLYREKFLALTARLKEDQDNPNLRREAFIANLEKHLVHELLHKAGEALGKTREEVNSQLGEVIRLVDLGKIIHQMGDLILFEQRVISDIQKTEAITQAEEIVRENPGSEIRVEKLDDRFGAELVRVIKPGEAEILYQDEYLWYPYDNDRDKKLEERRAEAKRVLDAFPGARLLERHAMTYIHEGGGTEIMYYFIVYRQKKDISGRLKTVLEELLSLITLAELDDGDEKLACVITALTNEYYKAQGIKRILLGMLLAKLGKESRDLIVLSKPLPVKNIPNVVTWTNIDRLKELIREKKIERAIFILDNETRILNFGDFEIGREYDITGIGRSFFVPMVPDIELLQLLSLVQEIFTADLKSEDLSPELKRLLAGEDLEELRPVKLLKDLEKAKDELIELIRSS